MVEETNLDLEDKLKKHATDFFDKLPKNFSFQKYDSSVEIVENFCFCKFFI